MMAACRGEPLDRVPVAPDISNYLPCKYTNKPFWDIYFDEDPALWLAYINLVKQLGVDGWFTYGKMQFELESGISYEYASTIVKMPEYRTRTRIVRTPDGDLDETIRVGIHEPPTLVKKMVENIKNDYKKLRHLFARPIRCDRTLILEQKKILGEHGMLCVNISTPSFPVYLSYFNGNLEALTYAYYDYPEIFDELVELHHIQSVAMMEMIADSGVVDSILFGLSGGITLQSPDIFDRITFPTIKKVSAMCREAGIISGLHSCGKEYHIIKRCAEETALDYINPLEIAPMGDCDLEKIALQFGDRLTLMGNLHTTGVMLMGSPEDVKRESLKAIRTAAKGGRFILSTGDQCGYATPEENILMMLDTVEMFGKYPLDLDAIDVALEDMGRKEVREAIS
jgi:hypothetical protein